MKKIVEAVSNGAPVGTVLIDLVRIWPWARPPEDGLYIREAEEEFYFSQIELPADIEFIVRDPRPGDPTDY